MNCSLWTPACAGVTGWVRLAIHHVSLTIFGAGYKPDLRQGNSMPRSFPCTPRLLAAVSALGLLMLPGCLAAAATGAVVGAAGATIGAAGDVAEGAVDVVTTSDEEEERNRRRERD